MEMFHCHVSFRGCTLSPIIMEVENGGFLEDELLASKRVIFHFHETRTLCSCFVVERDMKSYCKHEP